MAFFFVCFALFGTVYANNITTFEVNYETVSFENGSTYYNPSSINSFRFKDYIFSTNIMSSMTHTFNDEWTRQIRFARCKSKEDLIKNISDSCDVSIVSEENKNDSVIYVSKSLEWIKDIGTDYGCTDIIWYDTEFNGNSKLQWYVSYNAIKMDSNPDTNVYDQMCIEQKYSINFAYNIEASASLIASPELEKFVEDVRVLSTDMTKCPITSIENSYKLSYDILITLKTNASNGLTGYVPFASKPLDEKCHFDSNGEYDTDSIEQITENLYIIHMSTECRTVALNECDTFQTCIDGKEGKSKYGVNVVFRRGNDNMAMEAVVDVTIMHTECIGDESFLHNITGILDIWGETQNNGFQKINPFIDKVKVDENYYIVLYYETSGIFDAAENTRLTNVSGYIPVSTSECSDCSYMGCKSDLIASADSFGFFASKTYEANQIYVWQQFIPTSSKDVINVDIETIIRNQCIDDTIKGQLEAKARIHKTSNLNVTQTFILLYDVLFDDIDIINTLCKDIYHEMDIFISSCIFSEALTGNTIITFDGTPSSIEQVYLNVFKDNPNALERIDTVLNKDNILDTSIPYVEDVALSTGAIAGIATASASVVGVISKFAFDAIKKMNSGFRKLSQS